MRIGLMSDTHSYLDPRVLEAFADCDEVWHAGDLGTAAVAEEIERVKPLKAVWGNIDGPELRGRFPEELRWRCEGVSFFMLHITGYPGRWSKGLAQKLRADPPDVVIGGHSHILKIVRDPKLGLLHLNPGACGHHGFHQMRTVLRFEVKDGKLAGMQIVELGLRGMTSIS
jgi:putative phosphoesterase